MVESFTISTPLSQTTPVDRVRDTKREAIEQDRKRKRFKKSGGSALFPEAGDEPADQNPPEENKKSGKILDILI